MTQTSNFKTGMSAPCPEKNGQKTKKLQTENSKKTLSDGKKIGGQGRLTGRAIDTIQPYGLAIRRNSMMGVQAMRSDI